MKKKTAIIYLVISMFVVSHAKAKNLQKADTTIEGRWDITINEDGKESPSWLEVRRSGSSRLIGEFVGSSGSARPISRINYSNGTMSFTIPPQWEAEENDLAFEARLDNGKLSGTMKTSNGKMYNWSAARAPSLQRTKPPVWGKPIRLFNGTNLNGWHAMGENQWKAEGGILRNPRSGSNLVTNETFTDFKLHVEFRYPQGSNSGIYLRGRYEVQIEDNKGSEPSKNKFGGVYGFISPTEMVAKEAGQWQSYDITLVGRMITVVANGKMIICNQEIPGITGGALNSKEGEPGPIYFQGDHGAIDYRNIIITPAK